MDSTWKTGRTLITNQTRKWSDEQFLINDTLEGRYIFSNFQDSDEGRSRQVICEMNHNHPDFEKNRTLIEAAPDLKRVLIQVLEAHQEGGRHHEIKIANQAAAMLLERLGVDSSLII